MSSAKKTKFNPPRAPPRTKTALGAGSGPPSLPPPTKNNRANPAPLASMRKSSLALNMSGSRTACMPAPSLKKGTALSPNLDEIPDPDSDGSGNHINLNVHPQNPKIPVGAHERSKPA
ncbi:hypothetical protein FRC12_018026 [Ceratobasidium sp. 428]|nr:hypothetical protein FRC12_018026 [Ceratobasidium sp. 428]